MYLKKSQIIVIKIGSSLLIDEKMIIRKKCPGDGKNGYILETKVTCKQTVLVAN